jgi:hypothetical protein
MSGSLLAVWIAVNPSMEAMSETSYFAHSSQRASDPLKVIATQLDDGHCRNKARYAVQIKEICEC